MKKLKFKELIKIIKENYEIDDFAHGEFSSLKHDKYKDLKLSYREEEEYILNDLGLGQIDEVDIYDSSYQWYVVHHFVEHNIFIKTEGYRDEYNQIQIKSYGRQVKKYPKITLRLTYSFF